MINNQKLQIEGSYQRRDISAPVPHMVLPNLTKYNDSISKILQIQSDLQVLLDFNEGSNRQANLEANDLENKNFRDLSSRTVRNFSSKVQDHSRFHTTRNCGWYKVFGIILDLSQENYFPLYDLTILDIFDSNASIDMKVRELWKYCIPKIERMHNCQDVPLSMTQEEGKLSRKKTNVSDFEQGSVDCAIGTFSLLHSASENRDDLIGRAKKALKKNGFFIFHDCIDGFPTERWYPDIVMKYQPFIHSSNFMTNETKLNMLKQQFDHFLHKKVYDPFYLVGKKGQSQEQLKREFYSYLIDMYSLSKLLPNNIDATNLNEYEDETFWEKIDVEFSPYFKLETEVESSLGENIHNTLMYSYLKDVRVPLTNRLSFEKISNDQYALIAPRTALVAIGC